MMVRINFILGVCLTDHTWFECSTLDPLTPDDILNYEYGLDGGMVLDAASEAYEKIYGKKGDSVSGYFLVWWEEEGEDDDWQEEEEEE